MKTLEESIGLPLDFIMNDIEGIHGFTTSKQGSRRNFGNKFCNTVLLFLLSNFASGNGCFSVLKLIGSEAGFLSGFIYQPDPNEYIPGWRNYSVTP